MNEVKAEDLAFGRWPDILVARGMDRSFFTGKNGPCPFCGGKDRYAWSHKYGGVWVCRQCTNGKYATGFSMLMQHMGYQTFGEAADDVRDFFSVQSNIKPLSREARMAALNEWTPERVARNRTRMLRTWNEAREVTVGDPVHRYMLNRVPGMNFIPAGIRFHPALEYWDKPKQEGGKPVLLGKFPAMLAYAQGVDGELVQLHKTYLTMEGLAADVPLRKKTDLGVGVNSLAVRLMEVVGDTLGVSEGLETAWAAAMLRDVPVWSCLNGPALSEFVLPQEYRGQVRRLLIYADSDELKQVGRNPDGSPRMRRAGSEYAQKLAQRAIAQGLKPMIVRPAKVGDDMADYWKNKIAA